VVVRVGFVGRKTDGTEARERQTCRGIVVTRHASRLVTGGATKTPDDGDQSRLIGQVVFRAVTLEAIGIADIGHGQNSLRVKRVLYAEAPLVAGRELVRLPVQTGEAGRIDRERKGRSTGQGEPRIIHLDRRWGINL